VGRGKRRVRQRGGGCGAVQNRSGGGGKLMSWVARTSNSRWGVKKITPTQKNKKPTPPPQNKHPSQKPPPTTQTTPTPPNQTRPHQKKPQKSPEKTCGSVRGIRKCTMPVGRKEPYLGVKSENAADWEVGSSVSTHGRRSVARGGYMRGFG